MDEGTYETPIEVRFRDLDSLGHVNNAVYATYFEQARLRYLQDVHGVDLDEVSFVVARLEVDYRAPIEAVEPVTVGVGVDSVGETSFTLGYAVENEAGVKATGRTVQVVLGPDGTPAPISEDWRARLESEERSASND